MRRIFNILSVNLTAIAHEEEIADVPCGTCVKCCTTLAPYLTPDEITSGKYPISLTQPTHADLMDNPDCGPIITIFKSKGGGCASLIDSQCSIYDDRPIACRQFDCRKGHHESLVEFAKEKFGE